MKALKVPDMHCQMCVNRINTAFEEDQISCTIALTAQTVTVSDDDVAKAIDTLDDLGFTVAE